MKVKIRAYSLAWFVVEIAKLVGLIVAMLALMALPSLAEYLL